jgi:hypothetical protein
MVAEAGKLNESTTGLRTEIEQTRSELSHTIDAIHNRLRPRRLAADAKDTIRQAALERVERLKQGTHTQIRRLGRGTRSGLQRVRQGSNAGVQRLRENPRVAAVLLSAAAGIIALLVRQRYRRRG